MPEYRRYVRTGRPMFVTVVTRNRTEWLARPAIVHTLLASMNWAGAIHPFRNHAYVVLPNHFHWLVTPVNGADISRVVAAVKRDLTWRLKASFSNPRVWQPRFYDHVIRDSRDFARHLDYIHFNPVHHGYVDAPTDYPWSSFRHWVRTGVYERDWGDSTEPISVRGMDLE